MVSWRAKQQFKFFSFIAGAVLLVLGAGLFFIFSRPGTCSDGKQNNGELGVDCGGSCARLCPFEVSDVIVHWARSFPAREGFYDAAAFLENPNFSAGVKKFAYTFNLYDAKNILVGTREGITFLNPGEHFVVYENGIKAEAGSRAPQRTFFEAKEEPLWETAVPLREKSIIVRETRFEASRDGGLPRVVTVLVNQSTSDFGDIEVVALLFDADENVTDASKTVVSRLDAGETRKVTLLLSPILGDAPARMEVFPHWDMFE
ncbi:MAG: hypothetical protein HYT29_02155 [Parcubacteria group bacterium]|nr:hypothetical protein [Parcubacteria group bacterium]